MPKIIFKIDLNKEAENWVRVANLKEHSFGRSVQEIQKDIPKEILEQLPKLSKNKAIKLVVDRLNDRADNFMPLFQANKGLLDFYFKHNGDALFNSLEKITGKKMYAKSFTGYFILLNSCTYDLNSNSFMIMGRRPMPKQLTTICHEILHLQFVNYYGDYCLEKGLTQDQFQKLKEAITFLLNNPIFKKLYLVPDMGHPNHKVLRGQLKKIWDKNKQFDKFLDKAIEAVKIGER